MSRVSSADSLRDLCGHLCLDPRVDETLKLLRRGAGRVRRDGARQLGAEGFDRLRHLGARCHVLVEAVVEEAQPLRQGVELARDHRIGDRCALRLCELLADCVEVVGELVDARVGDDGGGRGELLEPCCERLELLVHCRVVDGLRCRVHLVEPGAHLRQVLAETVDPGVRRLVVA